MYCKKCGKELKENDRFCSGCGARIDASDSFATMAAGIDEKKPEPSKFEGRKFHMEGLNWDLAGYPTEEESHEPTASTNFNWSSVVDDRDRAIAGYTAKPEPARGARNVERPAAQTPVSQTPVREHTDLDWTQGSTVRVERDNRQKFDDFLYELEEDKPESDSFKPDFMTGSKSYAGTESDYIASLKDIISAAATSGTVQTPEPAPVPAAPAPAASEDSIESSRRKIDKFYTFNKKNEEFQQLLDQEYERLRERIREETKAEEELAEKQAKLEAMKAAEELEKQAALEAEKAAQEAERLAAIEAERAALEAERAAFEAEKAALEAQKIAAATAVPEPELVFEPAAEEPETAEEPEEEPAADVTEEPAPEPEAEPVPEPELVFEAEPETVADETAPEIAEEPSDQTVEISETVEATEGPEIEPEVEVTEPAVDVTDEPASETETPEAPAAEPAEEPAAFESPAYEFIEEPAQETPVVSEAAEEAPEIEIIDDDDVIVFDESDMSIVSAPVTHPAEAAVTRTAATETPAVAETPAAPAEEAVETPIAFETIDDVLNDLPDVPEEEQETQAVKAEEPAPEAPAVTEKPAPAPAPVSKKARPVDDDDDEDEDEEEEESPRERRRRARKEKAAQRNASRDTFGDIFEEEDEDDDVDYDTGRKKGRAKLIFLDILIVILALCVACAAILVFAEGTPIAQKLQNGIDKIVSLVTGDKPEEGDGEPEITVSYTAQAIENQLSRNTNIDEVAEDTALQFSADGDYGIADITTYNVFEDSVWHDNVNYSDAVVGTLIEYYSKLVDRLNSNDEAVLALITPGSQLYGGISAITADPAVQHDITKLQIGEFREKDQNFYVLVRTTQTATGVTDPVISTQVVHLVIDGDQVFINDIVDAK